MIEHHHGHVICSYCCQGHCWGLNIVWNFNCVLLHNLGGIHTLDFSWIVSGHVLSHSHYYPDVWCWVVAGHKIVPLVFLLPIKRPTLFDCYSVMMRGNCTYTCNYAEFSIDSCTWVQNEVNINRWKIIFDYRKPLKVRLNNECQKFWQSNIIHLIVIYVVIFWLLYTSPCDCMLWGLKKTFFWFTLSP